MTPKLSILPNIQMSQRTAFHIVKASGENILTYLQGQMTQDIKKLSSEQALYATILNPQGKAVTDFYLLLTQQKGDWAEVMFLCQKDYSLALLERLNMFALGHDLRMGKLSSWHVWSLQGKEVDTYLSEHEFPVPKAVSLASAQLGDISALRMQESEFDGVWLIGAELALQANVDEEVMVKGRIIQGIPMLGVDWDIKLHPLNANLIERDGVSFDKGCYVGQEVTSRMQWRGGIKKKLYRVQLEANVSLPCPVFTTAKVGEITSLVQAGNAYVGIALLPIETVESEKSLQTEAGDKIHVLGICGE